MNYPEIFTPEERDENEERKRELIELVVSGEAILIVGAGSSARVGYVTWEGLTKEIKARNQQIKFHRGCAVTSTMRSNR